MNVLAISNLYPTRHEPTRGMFNVNGFRPLARRCDLRLLVPVPWWKRARRGEALWRTPRETGTGVDARYPTFWSLPRLAPAIHARALYASLRPHVLAAHRQDPIDALLAAWAYPDAAAAAHLARELRLPLVTMVLGSDVNSFTRLPALRSQIVAALEQSGRVLTVSHALRERVIELGIAPERVITQHNGVDGERFRPREAGPIRARLGLPNDRPVVLFVGNLVPEKGPDLLIEAAARLAREDHPAEFALVGDGPLRESLTHHVRQLGLERMVRFHGRRPHDEIADWLCAADVLCLPSRREGCPNVVLESLASGRPVTAARVGGLPELVHPHSGALVKPESGAALAEGLRAVLEREWDPAQLRASVPCLSWDNFADTIFRALETARAEQRAGGFARQPA